MKAKGYKRFDKYNKSNKYDLCYGLNLSGQRYSQSPGRRQPVNTVIKLAVL
jgi:hypothetical protein